MLGRGEKAKETQKKVESLISGFSKEDVARLWSDPTEVLDSIEHALRMHELKKDGWYEPIKEEETLMTKRGWRQAVTIVWFYINPLNNTGKQTLEQIALRTIDFVRVFGRTIRTNWKAWGVKARNIPQIIAQFTTFVEIGLSKTDGMAFLKELGAIRKESMILNKDQKQPSSQQIAGLSSIGGGIG